MSTDKRTLVLTHKQIEVICNALDFYSAKQKELLTELTKMGMFTSDFYTDIRNLAEQTYKLSTDIQDSQFDN
jgi:hypothetical protein